MNSSTLCRNCGRKIPSDAPQGICPTCIFGLVGKASEATAGSHDAPETPKLADVVKAFPHLEILETIGHGGMGAVYRVRQIALDRMAALKLLNVRLANDPLFQERFAREAKLMARLVHPNIATIFEFGQSADYCFLLMEFIDGINLREAIRAKSTASAEALRIIPQICDALQYAHDQGVIHRDVKPENILLDKYGRVKLVDFGLAKLTGNSTGQISLTGTQQIMGTMNYMAPEQRELTRTVDHRADIYSLGVVFYELLTGELPLGKFSEPSLRANSDQRLDPVVMRTLEKDPEARYQSASEVKTAVNAASNLGPAAGSDNFPWESKTASRDEPTLPFQLGDNIETWTTSGLARMTDIGLRLEYHRKHKWWGYDQGIGKTVLPFNEIDSVRLKHGPISRGIEIRTRSLECLADILGTTGRGIILKTKPVDDNIRNRLFDRLCSILGQHPETGPGIQQVEAVRNRLQGPLAALALTAGFNLVASLVALAALFFFLWSWHGPTQPLAVSAPLFSELFFPPVEGNAQVDAQVGGVQGDDSGKSVSASPARGTNSSASTAMNLNSMSGRQLDMFISLLVVAGLGGVLGMFQLYAWNQTRLMQSYWTGIAGFISALTPLHPGWIFGLPTGIWGLVAMGNEASYSIFESSQPDVPKKPRKS